MATPIDNKRLLEQFLEGGSTEEGKISENKPKEEFPNIEEKKQVADSTANNSQKKNLRFSITVPATMALTIREYVSQTTIQHLMNGGSYSLSQFFTEAAAFYIQEHGKSD